MRKKRKTEPIETGPFKDYPDVMTVDDLRRALRIGRLRAYKLLSSGAIYSFKIGKIYKIPKDSLIAYMNSVDCTEVKGGGQK